ncbi:MAG: DNA adenine methylase, partial [Dehalococcoidia bacterium]|nr:DNA adenine methylase [Dehalococcoidia bacterium]
MINSPFKWVGGKSRLRKAIIPLIPPHRCYVEPFSGAAWVLFGKPPSPIEVLNDIDE